MTLNAISQKGISIHIARLQSVRLRAIVARQRVKTSRPYCSAGTLYNITARNKSRIFIKYFWISETFMKSARLATLFFADQALQD
jgi:hypothetical protein